MKKIPKRYLLVLSLILSLGLSGLIAPSAQPIQARRYQDHSVYQHRTYQHKTYQRRTYQKRVYRRHTHPRRTYQRRTYQKRAHRRRFHIRRYIATAVNSSASAKASRLARLNYQGSPILILEP